jgi:hypothetical protein
MQPHPNHTPETTFGTSLHLLTNHPIHAIVGTNGIKPEVIIQEGVTPVERPILRDMQGPFDHLQGTMISFHIRNQSLSPYLLVRQIFLPPTTDGVFASVHPGDEITPGRLELARVDKRHGEL